MTSDFNSHKRVAIFASGNGTNAEALMRYFKHHLSIQICAVFVNNPHAGVISKAEQLSVPVILFNREEWEQGVVLDKLISLHVGYIMLAGFLWMVPVKILSHFKEKILNIHPSLLPSHGGKGMYGLSVHKAVLKAGDKESGITIHVIDEEYDKGKILFQKSIPVLDNDTAESLAKRVNQLELKYYAPVAETYFVNNFLT